VNAYTIGDYWLCKGVDESSYPYKPLNPTNIFYDTDERVCFLFVLEYVTTSHNIIIKWYDPEDRLFRTGNDQVPDPRSEGYDYWENYSYYYYLIIKDDDAADLPGQWRVEVYIDDKKEFMENFEIRSTSTTSTTTEPAATTISSPTHPSVPRRIVPQEEMSTTSIITSTSQEEGKIEQSNFLSNSMYLAIIALAVIIVMFFIVLTRRKRMIKPRQIGISNKYCMNCGELVDAEETFCGSCGQKVD
jgi:hypothetical protein